MCTVAALFPLYLKYRVVLTDERCKGKITGIAEQRGGYSVGGYAVKKRAYLVKISGKQYYTAHGCLFAPLGENRLGKRSGCSAMKPTGGKYSGVGILESRCLLWCSFRPLCSAFCMLEPEEIFCSFS